MEADTMIITASLIIMLTGILVVSGCASRFGEWCKISQGLGQVLNK
jgi:hypothetical protein